MKRLILSGLMTLALAVPALAQGKKKDDKKPAPVVDAENLAPGQLAGKVMQVSANGMQVRVDVVHYEFNAAKGAKLNYDKNKQIQQLIRDQQEVAQARQKVANARNPREQQRAVQNLQREVAQMQQHMQQQAVKQQLQALASKNGGQNLFKEVHDYKDIIIDFDDSAKFRSNFLPSAFDEMGNIKKYTDKEKLELKGEGAEAKLVGYKVSIGDVRKGAMVAVVLSRNKETENKVRATLVLITKESDEPVSKAGDKKKPKK